MDEKSELKNKILCKICNKKYSSQSSLCNHNKKFHYNKSKDESKESKDESKKDIISNKYLCRYCNKNYKHKQTRWTHEQNCKQKDNNKTNENEIIELKKELLEVKNTLLNLVNSNKIHPKTLQKINKQLINNTTNNNNTTTTNTTTNNNTNTTTTINNVNIKFGYEKLSKLLTEKEIIKILNNCCQSVEESVKLVHFNDKRPEYKNILITNLRDNIAYIYDGNKFIAQNKENILTELFDNHFGNIESCMDNEEIIKKLNNDYLYNHLIRFINKINGKEKHDEFKNKDGYRNYKINELKTLIYNNTDSKVLKN